MALKKKTFLYKLYSSSGVFKKVWNDVISEPVFASVMNGGFTELTIDVARNTESFGEDADIKYNNHIKVYAFDDENGTSGGALIYSGRLTGYVPSLHGREETLKVTFLSYWQQAQQIIIEDDGSNYTLTPAPIFKPNSVSKMEANNVPAPFLAASSTDDGLNLAFMAFDGNNNTEWHASATTGWIRYYFGGVSVVLRGYAITAPIDTTRAPKTWTLEGSDDASSWTTIDTQTNINSWASGERKQYEFSNATGYKYYRLNISANNGGATYVGMKNFEMFEAYARAGATSIRYKDADPSDILKDLLDRFTQSSVGGKLDYDTGTISATGQSVEYVFESMTYQEAFQAIVDLCPVGWYIRIGADDIVYLKQELTTVEHSFILGRHITEFDPEKRIDSVINGIFFFGGDDGSGNRLYKKAERSSSISSYGRYDTRINDENVHDEATIDIIMERILDNFDSPEIRVVVKILDSNNEQGFGYDIESIFVGQTCKIENATSASENRWDQTTWDTSNWDFDISNAAATLLQIQRVEYHPDYVILELSNRQPDIARRIEMINKRLVALQVKNAPVIPL